MTALMLTSSASKAFAAEQLPNVAAAEQLVRERHDGPMSHGGSAARSTSAVQLARHESRHAPRVAARRAVVPHGARLRRVEEEAVAADAAEAVGVVPVAGGVLALVDAHVEAAVDADERRELRRRLVEQRARPRPRGRGVGPAAREGDVEPERAVHVDVAEVAGRVVDRAERGDLRAALAVAQVGAVVRRRRAAALGVGVERGGAEALGRARARAVARAVRQRDPEAELGAERLDHGLRAGRG